MSAGLALVVLNWNGADDTLDCLRSLRASTVPVHAVVVDNGSAGDDAERIRASGLADVVLETGANLGYAGGNDVGLEHALAHGFPVVGVLNNDTLVEPDCVAALLAVVDDRVAAAPTIGYAAEPHRVWFGGGIVDRGWPRHLQADELDAEPGPVRASGWLTGCCIVAHADTWRRVGLFDRSYHLIYEDADWSLRARRAGVSLVVARDARIAHKVSRSFAAGAPSLLGSFYATRNGLRFEVAHARRHLPRLVYRELLRPTVARLRRAGWERGLGFRWLGLAAFLLRQRGPAPAFVRRLAERRA
jgi:GT2 family glycosyltransferase